MRRILNRLGYWLHWRREQAELREEMDAHRAMAGPRAMGNDVGACEDSRAVWLWPWLEAVGQGLRHGARRLRRTPGFTAAAVLTLALGIGATTAIFSVVEAVMLHPLPYPQSDRIAAFSLQVPGSDPFDSLNLPIYAHLRDHLRGVAAMGAYGGGGGTGPVEVGGRTLWARGVPATDGFFAALGVAPRLGRGFVRADTANGAPRAVVLTHPFWNAAFGGDPGAVGRTLAIDGAAATVVGVLPEGFRFQEMPADYFVAMQIRGGLADTGLNEGVIARLTPGTTLSQLRAQMPALAGQIRAAGQMPNPHMSLLVDSYQATQTAPVSGGLVLLLGAVGLLLLIACANVASLVVARALAQQPEIAMRRALGASRPRLLLQFLCEGAVLGALGGLAGVALAEAAVRALAARLPADLPLAAPVALDGRVVCFALLLSLAATVVFGLAAASQAGRGRLVVARFRRRGRGRDAMVACELALTLLLVAATGLLVRSLARMQAQPLGFDPAGRLVFETQLPPPPAGTADASAAAWRFQQTVLARLNALPGVSGAAVNVLPLMGQNNLPGEPVGVAGVGTAVEFRSVSPGYFAAMGMRLEAGRDLNAGDTASAPAVGVVSAGLARRFFRGRAIGRQVRMGAIFGRVFDPELAAKPFTIVGVVGDVKVQDVRRSDRPTLYVPSAQAASAATAWVVRGPVDEGRIRAVVAQVDSAAHLGKVQSYPEVIASTLAGPRFQAQMAGLFSLVALALSAVGVYGLLAFAVAERRREIGVRMALGARPGALAWAVARRGLGLALLGIAIGWLASLPLRPLVASQLFEVHADDPATLAAAGVLLLAVAAAACYWPARRATRVDVVHALRQD